MRAFYFLLTGAAALLSNNESLSLSKDLTTDSDQAQITQQDVNTHPDNRFLRTSKAIDGNDGEERAWARIYGDSPPKAEANVFLKDWVDQKKTMQYVAEQLGFYSLSQREFVNCVSFDALRKFVRMDYKKRADRSLPTGKANKKIT